MVKTAKAHYNPSKTFDTFNEFIEEQHTEQAAESGSEDSAPEASKQNITKEHVKKLLKSCTDSINHSRKLLKIFRLACHNENNTLEFDNPNTYTLIIVSSFKAFPKIFRKIFKSKTVSSSIKTSYKNLFRSFLSNSLYLIKQVRDSSLLVSIFNGLSKVSKFFSYFTEYSKNFVKTAAKIWGEVEKSGKLLSYSFIRKMMISKNYDSIETLKLLYVNYAKNSKYMSWVSYSSIETMKNCFIDLLGEDLSGSYQVLFTSLRQLSIYLSQAIKNPSEDRIKTIYNWQFLNSLILLGRSITSYKDLFDLASPLIQITSGILSLTNSPKYFPLKLHLSRVLVSIQSHCKVYIPCISPNIIEILASPSLVKACNLKKIKDFSFIVAIKASKDQLASELYRQQLVDECCECLIEHLGSVACFSSFPELSLPVQFTLKKHCKNLKNPVFRQKILHCVRLIQQNSDWVESSRKDFKTIKKNLFLTSTPPLKLKCDTILKRRQEIVNSKLSEEFSS
jgi:nucleolar complex protein 2